MCQERLFHGLGGVKVTCHDTHWLCLDELKAVVRTEEELAEYSLCRAPLHQELSREYVFLGAKVIRWKIPQDGTELSLVKWWSFEHEKNSWLASSHVTSWHKFQWLKATSTVSVGRHEPSRCPSC